MKPRTIYVLLAGTAMLTSSCALQGDSIEYEIPEGACEQHIGQAIPQGFFPPGEELRETGDDFPGASLCNLSVDSEPFFLAREMPDRENLEEVSENFDFSGRYNPDGKPEVKEGEFTAYIWPNLTVVTTHCTREEQEPTEYAIAVGLNAPDSLENPQDALAEFSIAAAKKAFNRVSYCKESDSYGQTQN